MALAKSTRYAPDIYRAINGILLVYKPAGMPAAELTSEIRSRLSDQLNQFEPRPIAKRLLIKGGLSEEKEIVEVPNLADHPLVVGPRYNPWELSISKIKPLGRRSSGLDLFILGEANRTYARKFKMARFVNVYQLSGKFGYITDNFFEDGKIQDKSTYHHIRTGKVDAVLSSIESSQIQRLYDAANLPLDSEQAYELAKAWPSVPPRMAKWPVIYRLRCIHLKLPDFKLEATVINENTNFLAQIVHDFGLALRSGAFTTSIRRVKLGLFDVTDSLTDRQWDLQSVIQNLNLNNSRHDEIENWLRIQNKAFSVRTKHDEDLS